MSRKQGVVSRRPFVQTGVTGTVTLSMLGLKRVAYAQPTKSNILFIMADDFGYPA